MKRSPLRRRSRLRASAPLLGLPAARIALALPAPLPAAAPPALVEVSEADVRALDVARARVINANGVLEQDLSDACGVQHGGGGGVCLGRSTPQGFLLSFNGGPARLAGAAPSPPAARQTC